MDDARSLFTTEDQTRLKQLSQQMEKIIYHSMIWEKTDPVHIVSAGGWFASKLQGQRPRDVDIFILCGDTYKDTYEIYLKVLLEAADAKGVGLRQSELSYNHNHKIWGVFSDQSVTPNIQYIFSKHRDRQRLVNEFDYAHTMISYCMNHRKLYTTYKSFDAAKNKKLIPMNDPQPWRRDKFIARGYIEIKEEGKSDPPRVTLPVQNTAQKGKVTDFVSQRQNIALEKYHRELMKAFKKQEKGTSFLQLDDIVAGQVSYPRVVGEAISKREIDEAIKQTLKTVQDNYTSDIEKVLDKKIKEVEAKEESSYSPRRRFHDTIRDGLKKIFGDIPE